MQKSVCLAKAVRGAKGTLASRVTSPQKYIVVTVHTNIAQYFQRPVEKWLGANPIHTSKQKGAYPLETPGQSKIMKRSTTEME